MIRAPYNPSWSEFDPRREGGFAISFGGGRYPNPFEDVGESGGGVYRRPAAVTPVASASITPGQVGQATTPAAPATPAAGSNLVPVVIGVVVLAWLFS
jgi:hypothetical protein